MGANKSRPLVKESARSVLARKNAMPEADKAAKSAAQAAINAVEHATLSSAEKSTAASQAVLNTIPTSVDAAGLSKEFEQPLRSDVLSQVSKWQLKTHNDAAGTVSFTLTLNCSTIM
ncbi:hypothetical protein EON65_56255 [archaeon]|nr:MAG: hypothetical protein EON65_56255 [archaeon]